MGTQYADIFERFLGKVTDYDLASLTSIELDDSLARFLKSAITNFKYCTKNLKDRDDTLMVFNIDLEENEQEILAKLMLVEWIRPQILSQENIKNTLGSRDYQIYSPANLLDKLLNLKKNLQEESQNDMTFYYYATE